MKLYEVPDSSYIRVLPQFSKEPYSTLKPGDQIDLETEIAQVKWERNGKQEEEVKVPPGAPLVKKGEVIKFEHIDGMYSLCQVLDQKTYEPLGVCHLAAWTEVELVELDEIFSFDKIRQKIGRSGYGKDGKGPYRQAALKDMNDGWLAASIDFVAEDHPHRRYYIEEQVYRQLMNISIPDTDA